MSSTVDGVLPVLVSLALLLVPAVVLPVSGLEEGSARLTPTVRATQSSLPTVVNIGTERIIAVSDPFEGFFREFFGGPIRYYREAIPLGSGVIVHESGLVITNSHVVRRASEIQVRLWNRETVDAVIVASDPTNDLALLRLPADFAAANTLHAIPLAGPGDLLLGETVLAIGNPFGLEHSVSKGVLSAKNRTLEEGAVTFNDILQTDAAINPGNSGGPLVNLDGDLIGINIAIRRDAEGIGFAVPLQRIEDVLGRWMVPSRFSLGVCGFIPHTQVEDGELRVVVAEVVPLTPAAEAGLEAGDQIVAVNGTPVTRAFDVSRVLWTQRPGDRVRLELRGRETVTVTVKRMPPWMLVYNRLGIKVQELTPSLCRALGLPEDMRGLTVSDFGPDEAFQEAGAQRGDIIFRIADRETPSVEAAYEVLQSLTPGTVVPVFMVRVQPYQGRLLGSRYALQVTLR